MEPEKQNAPAPTPEAAAQTMTPTPQDPAAVAAAAVRAERDRIVAIRSFASRFDRAQITNEFVEQHIASGGSLAEFRGAVATKLAELQDAQGGPSPIPGGVAINADERDKWMQGAEAWLHVKTGGAPAIEKHTGQKLNPGEFRGLRALDLARDLLERQGVSTRGMNAMAIAKMALTRGPAAGANQNTTSDFPVLLENVLNKRLQAEYALQPVRWRDVAAEGSVSDFREHRRYRKGSIGSLLTKLESGEFKHVNIPDGEKGSITATTKGVQVGVSRQVIVNDDLGFLTGVLADLGQASARSIDQDLFNLLAENAGLGPSIGPFSFEGTVEAVAKTLFHADRENIDTTAAAPSVDAFERMRVLMSQQMDPNGQDFLDLRPAVFVGPVNIEGEAKVVVNAEFDFASETSGNTGRFQKPNKVRDFVRTFVGTPRLTGTRYYLLADPRVAPVFEVAFLDGMSTPVMEAEDQIQYDGIIWLARLDYGVAAIDFRGGVTNAGA